MPAAAATDLATRRRLKPERPLLLATDSPQPLPVGSLWLLAATVLFYVPWLLALQNAPSWVEPGTGSSGEARMAEAWGTMFVVLFGMVVWLTLGGLMLLAWRKGSAPPAWSAASAILYALSLIATFGAARTYFTWPGGWSILVPALLPPFLALYAVGVRLPAIADGPMHLLPAIALGGVALTALAAIPFASIDPLGYPARLAREKQRWDAVFARRDAEAQTAAQRWEAGIGNLGPDSPLAAWLDYVNGSMASTPLHEQALDGARHAKSRQSDAVALLDSGQIRRLAALSQLDLSATPTLCAAYDRALRQLATTDDPFEAMVGEQLERQVPNIKFLLAAGCDLKSGLGAAQVRAAKVAATNPAIERWAQLVATLNALGS
jgi:hypothetical protein